MTFPYWISNFCLVLELVILLESANKENERRSLRSAFFQSAARARAPIFFKERRSRSRSHF